MIVKILTNNQINKILNKKRCKSGISIVSSFKKIIEPTFGELVFLTTNNSLYMYRGDNYGFNKIETAPDIVSKL